MLSSFPLKLVFSKLALKCENKKSHLLNGGIDLFNGNGSENFTQRAQRFFAKGAKNSLQTLRSFPSLREPFLD